MNSSGESLAKRRQRLSEEIARQRAELILAYQGMAKPLEYTQTGIRGFKALRQNAWLIALAPSFVGLVFSFFGWKKKGQADWKGLRKSRLEEEERELTRAAKKPLRKWLGRGWAVFQLYRRVRPYFP